MKKKEALNATEMDVDQTWSFSCRSLRSSAGPAEWVARFRVTPLHPGGGCGGGRQRQQVDEIKTRRWPESAHEIR